ncbi:uncharacterized protein A1O9_09865 [Exophiala aquamarina CBS 119918]|uniref:Zn(2)-C6 fungal-type domain-containing protein n=1 Tax=Exophiala aquamarina CBS 119918 TaxID=1182545 RepID=A0A072PER8_9EURO|nr:uncharacterized protein A1O9_09865 [Exophiala aquamarina CBS 119918]KEF54070.1 hypothetical protein A1O9_09865 [Exophiala aquamarina CBS 119918]
MGPRRDEDGPQSQEEQAIQPSQPFCSMRGAPCRKRKLRCDGVEPVGSTCFKASWQCLYQDIRKGVRKQRTSMKILEVRLAELESRRKSKKQSINNSSIQHIEKIPDESAVEVSHERHHRVA